MQHRRTGHAESEFETGGPRSGKKPPRHQAYRIFEGHFAASGDYKAAARSAGVSERTGRRWKAALSAGTNLAKREGQLPRQLTSFVGRSQELGRLRDVFEDQVRLVTILGAPGMGKTRLASQFANQALGRGIDVVFCDLRGASSRDDLCSELGKALNAVASATGSAHGDRVGKLLELRGPCLVVLDNFETLVDAAAATVARWASEASQAQFLVTSRRVLHVAGEHAFELGPLRSSASERSDEAMSLFLTRAKATEPTFDVARTSPNLRQLVERTQGVPLAIELAAAQMRRVNPAELLEELDRRTPSFEKWSETADVEPSTLDQAIEDSWRLLQPWERDALAQLTVFHRGFTTAAARQVLKVGHHPDAPEAGHVLTSLREASLLFVDSTGSDNSRRWSLYEAIREFAARRLSSAAWSDVNDRHARYFLAEGQRLVRGLTESHGPNARIALVENHRNLQAAFDWLSRGAESGSDPALVQDAIEMSLLLFESVRRWMPALAIRPLSDAIRWADGLPDPSTETLARLHLARAISFRDSEATETAVGDFRAAEVHARSEDVLLAEIDCERALAELEQGHHEAAQAYLKLGLKRVEGNRAARRIEGRLHRHLARTLAEAFLDPAAFSHYARAAALLDEVGDECEAALTRVAWNVHRVFFQRGDAAEPLATELARASRLREWLEEGRGRAVLGIRYQEQGRLEEACRCYQAAADLGHRAGSPHVIAYATMRLGNGLDEKGKLADALLFYARAEAMFGALGDSRNGGLCRLFSSGVLAREMDIEGARRALDEARAALQSSTTNGFEGLCDLQQAQIDVALARASAAAGEAARAEQHRARAEQRIHASRTPSRGAGSEAIRLPLVRTSPEARLLLRLLGRGREVTLWRDGRGFQVGSQAQVVLPTGRVIRRVLAVLAERRMAERGRPVSHVDILRVCWPGERMHPESGAHRVRQTVHRLRRAGLEGLLLSHGDGYLLDPEVSMVWASEGSDETTSCDLM